jgi:hypothetical protein
MCEIERFSNGAFNKGITMVVKLNTFPTTNILKMLKII